MSETEARAICDAAQKIIAKATGIEFSKWKSEADFPHLANLTLIPMSWKLGLDI